MMEQETIEGGDAMGVQETVGEASGGYTSAGGLDDNIVLVGRKDTMRYISAVMTQFNNGASEVIVKARGRAINRAVDVAERVRNQFMADTHTSNINIMTEEVDGERGPVKVSAIEITLSKK